MSTLRSVIEDRWVALEAAPPSTDRSVVTSPLPVRAREGALLVGIDAASHRHLLVPLAPRQQVEPSMGSRAVQLRTRPLEDADVYRQYADLALLDPGLQGVFTSLCEDVLVAVEVQPASAIRSLERVLASWRALLSGTEGLLTPEEIAGTFGELLVLERLLHADTGISACWRAPGRTPKDFYLDGNALEVKTSLLPDGRLVGIHGIDQLDAPAGGTLSLVWFRLLPSSGGRSLPELVDAVVGLAVDPRPVHRGLVQLGYRETDRPAYADTRYEIREELAFAVDSRFPRVVRSSFGGGSLPDGINRLRYSVDLDCAGARESRIDGYVHRFLERL